VSLEGLKAIVHLAANPVILECDAAAVVQELHSREKSKYSISMMVSEIKSSLESLPGFQVCKLKMMDNSVAC
jgi:hypothetical protein